MEGNGKFQTANVFYCPGGRVLCKVMLWVAVALKEIFLLSFCILYLSLWSYTTRRNSNKKRKIFFSLIYFAEIFKGFAFKKDILNFYFPSYAKWSATTSWSYLLCKTVGRTLCSEILLSLEWRILWIWYTKEVTASDKRDVIGQVKMFMVFLFCVHKFSLSSKISSFIHSLCFSRGIRWKCLFLPLMIIIQFFIHIFIEMKQIEWHIFENTKDGMSHEC